MEAGKVLVVGETPSLGRSIVDLLESGRVPSRYIRSVDPEQPLSDLSGRVPLVIAACNEHVCATARRWARESPRVTLVVVGSRDRGLPVLPGVRVVPLPLRPARFLSLIRSLLGNTDLSPEAPGTSPG
jgi:hypothetical protein